MAISKVIYKASAQATPEVWMDSTPATAAAADITAPKTAMLANGVVTTGTGSGGGGGLSNVVTGTFTGTATGQMINIPLNYSGNGYPIAYIVYPEEGAYNSSGEFYNLIKRYALQVVAGAKCELDTVPDYSSYEDPATSNNAFTVIAAYKSSTSSATTYQTSRTAAQRIAVNGNASDQYPTSCVVFKSATTMCVLITISSYGFAVNIPYRYCVVYST